MARLYYLLRKKSVLSSLLLINIAGTIYGYMWYKPQLIETPVKFLIFVPDSPTASLFFCFVLIFFLFGKNNGLLEGFAIVSLFKYGFWAVGMNIFLLVLEGGLHWTGYLLMVSHLGMAVEGLLYAPFYRVEMKHLAIVAVWVLHDVVIDYLLDMMPTYSLLSLYYQPIGYGTFWLTIFSLVVVYFLCVRKNHFQLSLE